MIIIPAIDILDNDAVRLFKGDYSQKTVYSKAPWELAKAFQDNGAELIHLVDLNGARNASDINKESILKIRKSTSLKIQIGGGIRDIDKLKYYLEMGMDRFIMGTAAVLNPNLIDDALKIVGDKNLIIGVDAYAGMVKISGWEESTKLTYDDLLKRVKNQGVTQIVFTDISQDGTLSGPNLVSYKHILDTYDFDLIASGGIASMKDILELSGIKAKKGLFGIITGKAIYEGRLSLKEAIDNTKKQEG